MNYQFLRIAGNYGLIANTIFGQFFDLRMALFISLGLSLISIPFYVRARIWDTVVFIAFMMAVNLTSALHGVPGCS